MAVITFYSSCMQETGNTVSAIALATYLGITKNRRILLVSTGLNDTTVRESLWAKAPKKRSGLFGPNTSAMSQNGIEELDRVIRSNRVTPDIITNYTRVALKDRLEALMSYVGTEEAFKEIQKDYAQILMLANKAYDTVIVDLDQNLDIQTQSSIINVSDVVIATTTQKLSNIEKLDIQIENNDFLKKDRTLIAIGKYDTKSKYSAKNISRNLLRRKEIINTIPYSSLLLEAAQEGKVIDIFIDLLSSRTKDENYFLIEELNRLEEDVEDKIVDLQMKK